MAAVYRDVSGYPEPQRSALQADLREYVRYEIDVAWALRREGIIANGGMDRMWRFQDKLQAFGGCIFHPVVFSPPNSLTG